MMPHSKHHTPFSRTSEEGFALPSVLFLVVILALLCLSILSVRSFHRQLLLHDLARKKADLASSNGITQFSNEPRLKVNETFHYEDGSLALVHALAWGLYTVAVSEGRCGKANSLNIALLGAPADSSFTNALTYSNPLHQLIFAGTASIIGDLDVGQTGTRTGVLANRMSPRAVPVEGRIRQGGTRKTPLFDTEALHSQIDEMDRYLGNVAAPVQSASASYQKIDANSRTGHRFDLSGIKDSVQHVVITGDAELTGVLVRRGPPLLITVCGRMTFSDSVRMLGLIALCSTQPVRIPHAVTAEHILLYSQTSVTIESGSDLTLQIIAPSIFLNPGAELHYPSALISNCPDTLTHARALVIAGTARVEGIVYMMKRTNLKSRDDLMIVENTASITGAVVCEEKMTLDGVVKGSVITDDFYFYESPTHYYGWLRTGMVDRKALPAGFLIPRDFASGTRLAVIDWL